LVTPPLFEFFHPFHFHLKLQSVTPFFTYLKSVETKTVTCGGQYFKASVTACNSIVLFVAFGKFFVFAE
jgi:hypothetical protein